MKNKILIVIITSALLISLLCILQFAKSRALISEELTRIIEVSTNEFKEVTSFNKEHITQSNITLGYIKVVKVDDKDRDITLDEVMINYNQFSESIIINRTGSESIPLSYISFNKKYSLSDLNFIYNKASADIYMYILAKNISSRYSLNKYEIFKWLSTIEFDLYSFPTPRMQDKSLNHIVDHLYEIVY